MSDISLTPESVLGALRADRDSVVPVIGAGVAIGCGSPSSAELAQALAQAARRPELGDDLYTVANALDSILGNDWVQTETARIIAASDPTASPAMQALCLVPGRLLVTTNYCDSAEEGIKAVGLRPVKTTVKQLDKIAAHQRDPDVVVVLHLHGHHSDPSTIVLTDTSYRAATNDERTELATRLVGLGHRLVFIGHTLGATEVHIRRDTKALADLFGTQGHVLVHADPTKIGDPSTFKRDTGVEPVLFDNTIGDHRFVRWVAHAIGAPALDGQPPTLPRCPDQREPSYVPIPVANRNEVATDDDRALFTYRPWFDQQIPYIDDVTDRCIVLLGQPGTGKTQTLRRIGTNGNDAPAYLRLPTVQPPRPGEDPVDVFVSWWANGCSDTDSTPWVTHDSLEQNSYTFLLDALDEVAPDDRTAVLGVMEELGARWPQHRWIVASRDIPQIAGDIDGFTKYELVPSRQWVIDYAATRGVTLDEIDEYIKVAKGLDDVIAIPQFAVAAVEGIQRREPRPTSALGLLLGFASRGLHRREELLRADRVQIDEWMDRLSLLLLVTGRDSLPIVDAFEPNLRGQVSDDVTADWLTSRVLLHETGGHVRSVNRVLRDGRAARALLRHPDSPAVLARYGTAQLGGQQRIAASWAYVVDLVLGDDPARWLPVIAAIEPARAARWTPDDAPESDRDAALATIWDWYATHRILLPKSTTDGELIDDADGAIRLARANPALPTVAKIAAALTSPEWTDRSNALTILGGGGRAAAVAAQIRTLIADPHPVVRRHAAEAARTLRLHTRWKDLLAQSSIDGDKMARETLLDDALFLAPDDERVAAIATLKGRRQRDAALIAGRYRTRAQQMDYLRANGGDAEWLDSIALTGGTWTSAEIADLGELWVRLPDPHDATAARRTLGTDSVAALSGGFRVPYRRELEPVIHSVAASVDDETLTGLAANGWEPVIARWIEWRNQPTPDPHPDPQPKQPTLAERIDQGDGIGIVARPGLRSQIDALDPTHQDRLRDLVDGAFNERGADGKRRVDRIERTTDEWTVPYLGFEVINWAKQVDRPLDEDDWYTVADLSIPGTDGWLRSQWQPTWMAAAQQRVASLSDGGVRALVANTDNTPMTDETVVVVAERGLRSEDPYLRCITAARLVTEGREAELRHAASVHPSGEADGQLVRIGDPDAEQRLLGSFIAEGCPSDGHGRSLEWMADIRDPRSRSLVRTALETMLRRGGETHELTAAFKALAATHGDNVLGVFDQLIGDPAIEAAPFLWYDRERTILRGTPTVDPRTASDDLYPTDL